MRRDDRTTPRRNERGAGAAGAACAFTLIELLIVVAIVAVLIGVLLPSLGSARDAGRLSVCLSNARQLVLALDVYAGEHSDLYAPGAADFASNMQRWHGARDPVSGAFAAEGGALTAYINGDTGVSGGAAGVSRAVRTCPEFAAVAAALTRQRVGFERSAGGYGYNNAFVGTRRAGAGVDPATGQMVYRVVTDQTGGPRWTFASPARTIAFADGAIADGNRVAGVSEYSFIEPVFWPERPGSRTDPSTHFRHASGSGGGAGAGTGGRAATAWLDGHGSVEKLGETWSSGVYPARAGDFGIGWMSPSDSNALYDDQ